LLDRNRWIGTLRDKNSLLSRKLVEGEFRNKILGVLLVDACQKEFAELPFLLFQKNLDAIVTLTRTRTSSSKGVKRKA
jgi:hypothetical protein